jgi:hypothetical protein
MEIMKLFGIVGLLCITAAVLFHNRKKQNILFIAGGVLLEVYSIYIQDVIFITLQAVFIVVALYALVKPLWRKPGAIG